jgi:hypothetical protein
MQRVQLIQGRLAELNKMPPDKRDERVRLPSTQRGEPLLCDVISLPVDAVLLNHESHRLKSQLLDDAEWETVRNEPHGEAAQRVIARVVREARSTEDFVQLKESLDREGQTEPGVITHKGVLINANTRAVALAELDDPTKRFVRAAVLPATVGPEEIALLELRLQMQRDLKEEYSLTNELLFIEELRDRRMTNAFIAEELRYDPEHPKKAENEVATKLRLLDLLKAMQRISTPRLPLSYFDEEGHALGYQTIKEILPVYDKYMDQDPTLAERYLQSVLLAVTVGVTSTHQLRALDVDFVDRYLMPQLEDDDEDDLGVTSAVANLGRNGEKGGTGASPTGVDLLHAQDDAEPPDVDIAKLISIVTGKEKFVAVSGPIPGSTLKLDQSEVRDRLKAGIITAAKQKKLDDKEEDKRHAPREALRHATSQVDKAKQTVEAVVGTPDFDAQLVSQLRAAYKKLKRSMRNLDQTLNKSGVNSE